MSRSLYPGSGQYTAHWSGDNGASWNDLRYSIASILNSGLFSIPMVGADICGFFPSTWEELCNRWIQVGVFYPFARDHSDVHFGSQELYLWRTVTHSAKKVLPMRYKLLTFFYTLLHKAHVTGLPVARVLFYVFPEDAATLDISDQFLLGDAILVSPVLTGGQTSVKAYFPNGTWYNLFDWFVVRPNGSHFVLDAPSDSINVHIRVGSIVPMQEYAYTTASARKTPITLLVALDGKEQNAASGDLFLDDDDEIGMEVRP
jgi:alpha-glucosidase (family GH31 glycosyl hydrolase)